jgi:hypothetical protein
VKWFLKPPLLRKDEYFKVHDDDGLSCPQTYSLLYSIALLSTCYTTFFCNPDITYLFLSRNFCRFSSGSSPPLDDEGLLAGATLAGRVAGASGDVLLTSEINT